MFDRPLPPWFGELLTPKELAQALAVSERTINRWHRLGTGPARITLGRKPVYRRQTVDAWLTARETVRCPTPPCP